MKIAVKNLGAIESGMIDLSKRVNIFCGYNGTGKTYFSYLIYALLRNPLHITGFESEAEAEDLVDRRYIDVPID